jgi:hypothetical protein
MNVKDRNLVNLNLLFETSGQIKNLLKPLTQEFGINYFCHIRLFFDNSHFCFTSNPAYSEHYYSHYPNLGLNNFPELCNKK